MLKFLCKLLAVFLLSYPVSSFAHSPLPPDPQIVGVRYWFWHALVDLDKSLNSWLNKQNPKQYSYRRTPDAGVDLEAERQAAETIYELVRADYLQLLESGQIDQIDMKNSTAASRLAVAQAIYRHSLSVHYHFASALDTIKNQHNDPRYRLTIFFTTFVHPDHRPLESLSSLSQSSERAKILVERVLDGVRSQMLMAQGQIKELVDLVQKDPIDHVLLNEKMRRFKQSSDELDYRLNWFQRKLKSSSHFANDILRENPDDSISFLEKRMADLGQGLNNTLKTYRQDQEDRYSATPQRLGAHQQGIFLNSALDDLETIFGRRGHVGGLTIFRDQRTSQDENVYSLLSDSAILQYLIAAGAAMAKISETAEVRGTWSERAAQELSYRKAQITSALQPDLTPKSTALTVRNANSSVVAKPVRRNFLTDAQSKRRSEIEDRLWRVFFENADLAEFGIKNPGTCATMVTNQPMITHQSGGLELKL